MNKLKTCGALLIMMLLCCTNVTAQQDGHTEFLMDRPETSGIVNGRLGYSLMRDHSQEDGKGCRTDVYGSLRRSSFLEKSNGTIFKSRYSTLLGSDSSEVPRGIAVRNDGGIIVVGHTKSPLFPITQKGYCQMFAGGLRDAFISIFSGDCERLLISTCFGGSGEDYLQAVKILQNGSIVVVGTTTSSDMPVTNNALQKEYSGDYDAFLAIFDSSCSTLKYCSYIGGSGYDHVSGLDVGGNGMLYIAGYTDSRNFPRKRQLHNYRGGYDDSFVYVFDPNADSLVFSSYFGGADLDQAYDIRLDCHSNIYIFGGTCSRNLPTTSNAMQTEYNKTSWNMGFMQVIDSAMDNVIYCTYIGGSAADIVETIDFDENDNIYITGQTISPDFITTPGVYMPKYPKEYGPLISYVMKFTKEKNLEWSTFIGGKSSTYIYAISMLSDVGVVLFGYSDSEDYPTTNCRKKDGKQVSDDNKKNAVLSILSKDATLLVYSKVSGGNANDYAEDMVYKDRSLYLCGQTKSSDLPMSMNAYQTCNNGQFDAFLSIVNLDDILMTNEMVKENAGRLELYTWPNPVTDRLHLKMRSDVNKPEYYSLVVTDVQGREVYRNEGEKMSGVDLNEQIPVESLSKGVYICRAVLGRHMQMRKIVKK